MMLDLSPLLPLFRRSILESRSGAALSRIGFICLRSAKENFQFKRSNFLVVIVTFLLVVYKSDITLDGSLDGAVGAALATRVRSDLPTLRLTQQVAGVAAAGQAMTVII